MSKYSFQISLLPEGSALTLSNQLNLSLRKEICISILNPVLHDSRIFRKTNMNKTVFKVILYSPYPSQSCDYIFIVSVNLIISTAKQISLSFALKIAYLR